MAEQFEISIQCASCRERHSLTVRHGVGSAYGAARPSLVELQYCCPTTGEARKANFRPPVGAAKPFSVASVE